MAVISGCQQVMALVVQIVLARLLIPHDYGVAALVMTIDSFAVVFSTAGIGTALVQRKDLSLATVDAAAVITGGMAVALGGILFFASDDISLYYALPEMSFLLKIAAIDILLKVMCSLYDSLLLRELRYKVLSLRTFISLIVQSVVSIILATHGFGAKSLVISYVTGSVTQLILCISATRYIPRTFGDYKAVKGIFKFGSWILLGRLANQAAHVLDQMIVAKFLNASALGLVNVSKRVTSIFPLTFLGFVGRVTLPVFSKWQDDLERIEKAYWMGLRINMMIVFPLCLLTGLFSYQILMLLYGTKWLAGEYVMKVLSFHVALTSIDTGYCNSVLYATGNPRYSTIVTLISLFLIPSLIYIGSFWGVIGIAWGMVSYIGAFIVINHLVLKYLCRFRISKLPLLILRSVVFLVPMFVAGYSLIALHVAPRYEIVPKVLSPEWFFLAIRMVGCAIVCMIVYIVTIYFMSKSEFMFLLNGILNTVRIRKFRK